ncbi:hypothetical protein QUA11_20370 [Microcoleus sp. S13_D1]
MPVPQEFWEISISPRPRTLALRQGFQPLPDCGKERGTLASMASDILLHQIYDGK